MAKTFAENESSPSALRSRQAPNRILARLWDWCELIKVEHTIFALPFALSGLILASSRIPGLSTFLWTILAFAGARAAAMSLNRVIDAEIDRKNPRTRERAIPKGKIQKGSATWFAVFSFLLMILAAYQLPPLCLQLAPIAVVWLSLYSFGKRFTWLCHFGLGIALGGAALGGWIASGGGLLQLPPWILAISVATWVAGFDIIYACLDIDFDRQEHISSLPAAFGIKRALIISEALHVVTIATLIYLGSLLSLGLFYWLGIFIAALALIWEHRLVRPTDLSKANAAFFNVNGLVSILVFSAILIDKLLSA
jgi:4-hydroxybenzoate polyprenyltransferase